MSDTFDHEGDAWDSLNDDHDDRFIPYFHRTPYGPALRCNRCGDKNVYWQTVRGKYLLYDKTSLRPHECPPKENNLEGFDE